jgi:hypothetical protein
VEGVGVDDEEAAQKIFTVLELSTPALRARFLFEFPPEVSVSGDQMREIVLMRLTDSRARQSEVTVDA